ncbi:5-hydroxytryptamine receptor 4-like [Megalops cyprinoides]|uniref:5-hydroxytryptamine receptor 4-like n=1 Tax=Megalops cyprinoides TaxID=118141 RepID=UPI0018642060|nr:5-hydroxytryptamine receptor 4-like [Megalops cyprinoides]
MSFVFETSLSVAEESRNLTFPGFNKCNSGHNHGTVPKVHLIFLLLPITVFAILGNLLIMVSVACFHQLQTATNIFVASLATADFLVAALVMPFSLVRSVDRWRFGELFCLAHFLLDVTLCSASIFNLTCVAVDRYLAVCNPLHYPARMTRARVSQLLLLSWLLPLFESCLIVVLGLYTHGQEGALSFRKGQSCFLMLKTPYAEVASVVSFLLPVGFMAVVYGRIFLVAHRQARRIDTVSSHVGQAQPGTTVRKERKAAKTLGVIMGAFLLCWLPFFTINLAHPLWGSHISHKALECVLWLGYTNSAINPLLYAFFNSTFRRAFTTLLGCRFLDRHLQNSRLSPRTSGQTGTGLGSVSR